MTEIDKYYQILGLNPGASEEEIKQAYKDLVNVWHPDRFLNNPRLREKANEKLKEINEAYGKLKSHIAGNSRRYASPEEDYAKSQPPPREPPRKSKKEQSSTTENGGYGESKPPPNEPPPDFSQHSTQKPTTYISWIPLPLCFIVFGSLIGSNLNNELMGAISGLLIGTGVSIFINKMDGTRKFKVRFAWGAAITGFLLYLIIFGLTASERYTPTSSSPSSSPNERLTSNLSPPASKTPKTSQKFEGTSKNKWVYNPLHLDFDPYKPSPNENSSSTSNESPSPPNPQPVADWKFLYFQGTGENRESRYFYDAKGIGHPTKDIVSVWVKIAQERDLLEGEKKAITEGRSRFPLKNHLEELIANRGDDSSAREFAKSWYEASVINVGAHKKILFEVYCKKKMLRVMSAATYDENLELISSASGEGKWNYIIPETLGDFLFKETCK